MDVIVLGGGLMGTASAFFLARRGLRVTLIERAHIGAGATVASFGNIRRTGRYLPQLPLAHRSREIWGEAEKLLGRDVEFRAAGHIRLVFDEAARNVMRTFIADAKPWGLDLEELDAADLARRFPYFSRQAIGASFSPKDGSANPRLIAPAFAEAARKAGVTLIDHAGDCTVRKIAEGFEVTTTKGMFAADRLLNCAGAWGAGLAATFNEYVPLVARGPQMGVTEPLPFKISPVVGAWSTDPGGDCYFRQVERGNIVFGGAAERTEVDLATGHAKADPARLPRQLTALVRLLPALADVSVIRTWSGCEGYVEDKLPVMGASATTPGLFHAFGFCGHGFQLGPGVGAVMADLIATGETDIPISEFRIDRFNQPPPQNSATLPQAEAEKRAGS